MKLSRSTEKGLEKHTFTAGKKDRSKRLLLFYELHIPEFKNLVLEFCYTKTNASEKISNLVAKGTCVTWMLPKILEKAKYKILVLQDLPALGILIILDNEWI